MSDAQLLDALDAVNRYQAIKEGAGEPKLIEASGH